MKNISKIIEFNQYNDDRKFIFNPIFLLFFSSCIINTIQIMSYEYQWSRFSVFNVEVNYNALLYQYIGFFIFYIGYLTYPSRKIKHNYLAYDQNRLKFIINIFFIFNFFTLIASQYYMGNANMYNIYITGTVTALDIEDKVQNSPFGIQSLSLLLGYVQILLYAICKLLRYRNSIITLSNIIIAIKFISTGKMQSLLYLLMAFLFCYEHRLNLKRLCSIFFIAICTFLFTRIVRNPDQDFSLSVDFILFFIAGAYFGSPIMNFSYSITHELSDFNYMFNHLIPNKILNKSQLNMSLPDYTSPSGLFGTLFMSGGFYALIICAFIFGAFTAFIYKNRFRYSYCYIFMPFLIMALAFSVMYNHFFNMVFFIVPILFSIFLSYYIISRPIYE